MVSNVAVVFLVSVLTLHAVSHAAPHAAAAAAGPARPERLANVRANAATFLADVTMRDEYTGLFYAETEHLNFEKIARRWAVYNVLDDSSMRCAEDHRDQHSVYLFCRKPRLYMILDVTEKRLYIKGRSGRYMVSDEINYFEVPTTGPPAS